MSEAVTEDRAMSEMKGCPVKGCENGHVWAGQVGDQSYVGTCSECAPAPLATPDRVEAVAEAIKAEFYRHNPQGLFEAMARAALAVSEEGGEVEKARIVAEIEAEAKRVRAKDPKLEGVRANAYDAGLDFALSVVNDQSPLPAAPSGEGQGEARADDLVGRIRVEITQCDKWARHHRNEAAETSVDLAYAREAVAVAEAFEDVAKRLRSALAAQSSEGEER